MKRLFYLSGSLFFLSLTLLIGFHLGQQTADAQSAKDPMDVRLVGLASDLPPLEVKGAEWSWERTTLDVRVVDVPYGGLPVKVVK